MLVHLSGIRLLNDEGYAAHSSKMVDGKVVPGTMTLRQLVRHSLMALMDASTRNGFLENFYAKTGVALTDDQIERFIEKLRAEATRFEDV